MRPFRNILVLINGDQPSGSLVARAARLAKQEGARLRLIAVVEELPWYSRLVLPDAERLHGLVLRDREQTLERLAEPVRQTGLSVTTGVTRGRPHIEPVREVIASGHDLLLKEAEPNENLLFGSTDMYLLRTCPCPVWLVKPEQGERPFAKILVTVDPAPPPDETDLLHIKADLAQKDQGLDAKILDLAGFVASLDGAELHVLHAWCAPGEEFVRGDALLGAGQVERYVNDAHEEARKAFDRLLAGSPASTGRRQAHLVKGDPAHVIPEFARSHGIDLIVMGTVARTGIPGLLIGNTAESVLQRANCSVLAAKPDGFVSPMARGTESAPTGLQ